MITSTIRTLEAERQVLQGNLDNQKTRLERNKLGQFATPIDLANDILNYGLNLVDDKEISFLDPAVGTGSFYSALEQNKTKPIRFADGYDIDPFYAEPAKILWGNSKLKIHIEDFTKAVSNTRYNLTICNPPYVRHHHISSFDKKRLKNLVTNKTGLSVSGYAGLYCYFMLLANSWMEEDAIAGWLIPSEFMDVNYGDVIKKYLLFNVNLLHIHRFDPTDIQFSDALVSSAIVWLQKTPAKQSQTIKFTFGGTLSNPKVTKLIKRDDLINEKKWSRFPLNDIREMKNTPTVGDFFNIKRGLATGANSFFILSEDQIKQKKLPFNLFRPILPSARYIDSNLIEAELNGDPKLSKKLYLLDTLLSEHEIKSIYPKLWQYLEDGKISHFNDAYICSHRSPWYSQEKRPLAPLFCTYMGRSLNGNKTFRFFLNKSKATVTNSYLAMYPTKLLQRAMEMDSDIIKKIWELLNSLPTENLINEGRVYGGGLYKLEPKELARVSIPFLSNLKIKFSAPPEQTSVVFI